MTLVWLHIYEVDKNQHNIQQECSASLEFNKKNNVYFFFKLYATNF